MKNIYQNLTAFSSIVLLIMASTTWGQDEVVVDLAAPDDSGWISLFDGSNLNDFFTFYDGAERKIFPDDIFTNPDGDTIRAAGPAGHIIHKQPFSNYTLRFQMHYPDNRQGNAGVLVHVLDEDPLLSNRFPRSLEAQGDPGQGMGQLWCISSVWVDVRATTGGNRPVYDPEADLIAYGNGGGRVVTGYEGWGSPDLTEEMNEAWSQYEIVVRGSDSIMHRVHGDEKIKYYNPRVASSGSMDDLEKYMSFGKIAWQSEGVPVMYRNLMVKLFPEDPLYDELYAKPGCTNDSATNYDSTATVDNGSCEFPMALVGSGSLFELPYTLDKGITVKPLEGKSVNITIFDMVGNTVTSFENIRSVKWIPLKLPGIYFVKVQNGSRQFLKKIMVY